MIKTTRMGLAVKGEGVRGGGGGGGGQNLTAISRKKIRKSKGDVP